MEFQGWRNAHQIKFTMPDYAIMHVQSDIKALGQFVGWGLHNIGSNVEWERQKIQKNVVWLSSNRFLVLDL